MIDGIVDREQMGETFVLHASALYRFALRMTSLPQEAEEAVSRTALRCLEKADHFRGESKVRTWLFGILTNVVREMRKDHWRGVSLDEHPYPPDSAFDSSGESLQTPTRLGDNPENAMLRTESVERIRAEMDGLPVLQRSAFHLRYFDDWDPAEICHALGITDTHLRVLLHRARLRLRERMVEYVKGNGHLSPRMDDPAMISTQWSVVVQLEPEEAGR